MQRRNLPALSPLIRSRLLCLLMILYPLCASAQDFEKITIPEGMTIKVQVTRQLSSGRVRIGDYVPLVVAEGVRMQRSDGSWTPEIINKSTPVFGRVVDRRHRFAFFRSGKFAIALDTITANDGGKVSVYIRRPQTLPREKTICKDRIDKRTINLKNTKGGIVPCVRGRGYTGTLINSLPSAAVAALTTTALVLVKDRSAKAAAAVTLAGQVATQPGLNNLINGIDAEIDKDEIFDAVVEKTAIVMIKKSPL